MSQGIKIGSNIASLMAQRRLGEATSGLARTYERLSSGQRINRASDDSAGLSIAMTLDASAKVFRQGVKNLNDGISYTSIAGGALKELKSILYRQRELATQSSNGAYSDQQRSALNAEFQQLTAEWNRILESTTYNNRKVFSAKEGTVTIQAGAGDNAVLQAFFGSAEAAAQDDIRRVSVRADGIESIWDSSGRPMISGDGRHVVFTSSSSNLVDGDTNGSFDIFVKDLLTGEVTRASTDSNGAELTGLNRDCFNGTISADGRYVAFNSQTANLVPGDTNGLNDIFVKDLVTGQVTRVSTDVNGGQANQQSLYPYFSSDGRYVGFLSYASNLAPGDTNGILTDIYVKDLQTGQVKIASVDSSGAATGNTSSDAPLSFSADGRYVTFYSQATNLVNGDTNGVGEVFVRDLVAGQTMRVSTDASGAQANAVSGYGSISADGRYVSFYSSATNLVPGDTNAGVDIFVKDLQTGAIQRASTDSNGAQVGSGGTAYSQVSEGGRYVVFSSVATGLVAGDTNGVSDIFVKDLQSGEIRRVSTSVTGAQGGGTSVDITMTPDGRYIAFRSTAANLVSGDSNAKPDMFLTGNPFAEWSTVSRSEWLSVKSQEEAIVSQSKIDNYLTELSSVEGRLGAIDARLSTATRTLQSMADDYLSAYARITDADIAQEAAELARTQIVQDAATAILAQANQTPALVLALLE